jgi:hypothetical protein
MRNIQKGENGRGYLRLCAGDNCFVTKRGILPNIWTHVAVVYSSENPSLFQNYVAFYINGVLDRNETVFIPTNEEHLPLTFGKPASPGKEQSFHGSLDNIF